MPSEQRLHPATLLFDLARHLKNFAVPAVLVIFGASRSSGGPGGMFGNMPDGWEAWLLVLFVPATLVSIARYISFRLRYDEHELVIRTGLVFRNERHIPFSRIQNVDAVQNVVHRLLHVVEIRVETGGGKDEEARLSVLPYSAFEQMRSHVFRGRQAPTQGPGTGHAAPANGETLIHLSLRELLLCGFLENKGMVFIGAGAGLAWETGVLNRITDGFFGSLFRGDDAVGRGFFRSLTLSFFDGGPLPIGQIGIAMAGIAAVLLLVRVISMLWAFVRLYDFRLTRIGEDLRSEYGLLTRVSATVPIRRVQAITIYAGPLHRWLKRATVRVATAGAGSQNKKGANVREWLAPLIHQQALPNLLHHVVPGFDLTSVTWQPVHPRAFARALKPMVLIGTLVSAGASWLIGWGAIGLWILMLVWGAISTRQYVAHLGWADGDEVVMMRTGWIWRQTTLARVNKIQAVTMHQSPFDRRAAMARVRVDTAGAGELSHRIDIPYLDQRIAGGLTQRLSAAAANTAFRW